MEKQQRTQLPRFVIGALATAGASAASGAIVQISFANNVVNSATGVTSFAADLTGDNSIEVSGLGNAEERNAIAMLGGILGGAVFASANPYSGGAFVASVGNDATSGVGGIAVVRGLARLDFSDTRINGGASTIGWLELEARAVVGGGASVQIHRLIFDDTSTTAPTGLAYTDGAYPEWQVSAVPEPGSSLALLALGAGGLTLRRRFRRAA
jgi:PEP-CTERM motif